MTKKNYQPARPGPRLPLWYIRIMAAAIAVICLTTPALAATDLWTAAQTIIVDIYGHIATLSTALAGLMSAIAVLDLLGHHQRHWSLYRVHHPAFLRPCDDHTVAPERQEGGVRIAGTDFSRLH